MKYGHGEFEVLQFRQENTSERKYDFGIIEKKEQRNKHSVLNMLHGPEFEYTIAENWVSDRKNVEKWEHF